MNTLKVICPTETFELEVESSRAHLSVADLLHRKGTSLNTRCGNQGLCDGCLIELIAGSLQDKKGQLVTATDQPQSLRGCEYFTCSQTEATIRIASRSLLGYEPRVVSDFSVNITCSQNPLIDGKITDSDKPMLGIAIDLGTTTVAVLLVDIKTGKIISRASGFNQQIKLGDDVLTRINLCMTQEQMLNKMHKAVTKLTLVPLIKKALKEADQQLEDVRTIVIAGNTTMLHLLTKTDPSTLGVAPFTPVFLDHKIIEPNVIGLPDQCGAKIHLLPGAAGYIGADLTAGIVSSGMIYDHGPCLLVDIGTNGEIICKYDHHLLGCATAAGPAFEGAGLTSGMRAGAGAISDIRLKSEPFSFAFDTIDDKRAVGLCGSAYVDFMAEAHRIELLNHAGRFTSPTPADAPLVEAEYGQEFVLSDNGSSRAVVISETDIASLLQAKAAIAAGISTLLDRVGMTPGDVHTLYLAGGFGMHLNIQNAIKCGLLPGFEADQIKLVGNTSLAGAFLCLLDREMIHEISKACQQIEVVELNLDPNFEMNFIEHLMLI